MNLLKKVINQVNINDDVAVIAVVGSGMRGIKGVGSKSIQCSCDTECQCHYDRTRIFTVELGVCC